MKKHFKIIGILSICVLIVMLPYFINRPFAFSWDQQLQYNYFYEEWKRLIENFLQHKTFPFYSFYNYLGNDFYSSKLYYLTGDIFMPLLFMFKDIVTGLMIETLILIVLGGFFFSLLLRKLCIKNENIITVGSILYAFSGIASLYVGQYMFHRFYCFLPLLLLGICQYLKNNKCFLFTISTTLCLISSYYFLFPTCLFMIAFYFFVVKHYNLKIKIKDILTLIVSFVVGVLLSCVLVLPGILFILNNERIGQFDASLIYDYKVYFAFLMSFINAPLTLFTNMDYLYYSGADAHHHWFSIYTGILAGISSVAVYFTKKKELKYINTVVLLFALIPFLSSAAHGFSQSSMRWVFLISTLNIFNFAFLFDTFSVYKQALLKGGKTLLALTTACVIVTFLLARQISFHLYYMGVCVFLLGVWIYYIKKESIKTLLILTTIEVVSCFGLHLYLLNKDYEQPKQLIDTNVLEYLQNGHPSGFYRIYVENEALMPFSSLNLNQSLHVGYRGVSTYDSTIAPSLLPFNRWNHFDWHRVDLKDTDVLRLLGVQYAVSLQEMPSEFRRIANSNHLGVYELSETMPLGFTYSHLTTSQPTDYLSQLFVSQDVYDTAQSIVSGHREVLKDIVFVNDNQIYANIYTDNTQFLFLSIPYDKGWKIKDNDVFLETYNVQGGFLGVILQPGEHHLQLQFTSVGFKQGVLLTLIGGLLCIGIWIRDKKVHR